MSCYKANQRAVLPVVPAVGAVFPMRGWGVAMVWHIPSLYLYITNLSTSAYCHHTERAEYLHRQC